MSTKITSRGYIDADTLGRLPTKEGATIGFGNIKREPVYGDEGVLGYSEQHDAAPFIKVTLVHVNETDEDALMNVINATITYTTNTGRSYTLSNAWTSDPLELAVKDGQLEVTFYGTKLTPQ